MIAFGSFSALNGVQARKESKEGSPANLSRPTSVRQFCQDRFSRNQGLGSEKGPETRSTSSALSHPFFGWEGSPTK